MDFREAIRKSVQGFYNGELPTESINNSDEEFKYTLEYFEELEQEDVDLEDE